MWRSLTTIKYSYIRPDQASHAPRLHTRRKVSMDMVLNSKLNSNVVWKAAFGRQCMLAPSKCVASRTDWLQNDDGRKDMQLIRCIIVVLVGNVRNRKVWLRTPHPPYPTFGSHESEHYQCYWYTAYIFWNKKSVNFAHCSSSTKIIGDQNYTTTWIKVNLVYLSRMLQLIFLPNMAKLCISKSSIIPMLLWTTSQLLRGPVLKCQRSSTGNSKRLVYVSVTLKGRFTQYNLVLWFLERAEVGI